MWATRRRRAVVSAWAPRSSALRARGAEGGIVGVAGKLAGGRGARNPPPLAGPGSSGGAPRADVGHERLAGAVGSTISARLGLTMLAFAERTDHPRSAQHRVVR